MKSYSQFGEDITFVPLLPAKGRALEIGAYHPTVFSNTRALFEKDWDLVLVEIAPAQLRAIAEEYGMKDSVAIVAAAIGSGAPFDKEARWQHFQMTDDAVSTNSDTIYAIWNKTAKYYGQVMFPVIAAFELFAIATIRECDHEGKRPSPLMRYDFISVDIEGGSMAVAMDLMMAYKSLGWKQPVWCIEHDGALDILNATAKHAGLKVILENGTNAILVPGDAA